MILRTKFGPAMSMLVLGLCFLPMLCFAQGELKELVSEIAEVKTDARAMLVVLQQDAEILNEEEKRWLQLEIEKKNNEFVALCRKITNSGSSHADCDLVSDRKCEGT